MVFLFFLLSEVKIVIDLNQRNYSVALQRAAAAILLEKMLEDTNVQILQNMQIHTYKYMHNMQTMHNMVI